MMVRGLPVLNDCRSRSTSEHMLTKPSQPDRKYFVKGLSKKRGSWGTTLSRMATTLHLSFIRFATYPSEGANHDIQYLMTRRSGSHVRMARAVRP